MGEVCVEIYINLLAYCVRMKKICKKKLQTVNSDYLIACTIIRLGAHGFFFIFIIILIKSNPIKIFLKKESNQISMFLMLSERKNT